LVSHEKVCAKGAPRRRRCDEVEPTELGGRQIDAEHPGDLGITEAHAAYMTSMAGLTPEQFERFVEFGRRPSDLRRGDYARLRRFLRAERRRAAE